MNVGKQFQMGTPLKIPDLIAGRIKNIHVEYLRIYLFFFLVFLGRDFLEVALFEFFLYILQSLYRIIFIS